MKSVVFFGFPAEGHLNPSIELCNQLSEKNVKIYYYTTKDQFYKFQHIENIEMKEYPDIFSEYGKKADELSKNISMALYMLYDMTNQLVDFAVNEVKSIRPALVLNDVFALWGKMAARLTHTPMGIFSCMFITCKEAGMNGSLSDGLTILAKLPTFIKAMQLRKKVEKKANMRCDGIGELFSDQGELTVVMSTQRFHPNGSLFGDNVIFLGSGVLINNVNTVKRDRILISLGTLCENKEFWNRCIRATKKYNLKIVLLAYGNNINNIDKSILRENVEVRSKMTLDEYEENIANAVLFINHGGLNGVAKAIMYKTPVLVCPDTSERRANGKRAEENACGLCMNTQNVKEKELTECIDRILGEKQITEGLEAASHDFLNSFGYAKTAEKMISAFHLDDEG